MAAARPLDSGVGSAAGATLRSADIPDGSRPARADVPCGRWPGPGDVAPSYLQGRRDPVDDVCSRGARQRRCGGDRRDLGFNLHPQLRGRRAAPRGPDRQCRDGERTTASLRRRGKDRHGSRRSDPPQPYAVGRTEGTALTAFTDGCLGLRRILLDAGVEGLPILDWFHIAMRLRHLTQIAGGLSSDGPERAAAKAVIVEEVERLRWRLWNGRAKDAKVSIDRIRAVPRHFR